MTLKLRNRLFILWPNLWGNPFPSLRRGSDKPPDPLSPKEILLKALFSPTAAPAVQNILLLFLLNIFLFTSGLILFLAFRKTSSGEIFFFFVFLLAMGCEGFRLGLVYIDIADLPFQLGMPYPGSFILGVSSAP